jgi:hypothetical protein
MFLCLNKTFLYLNTEAEPKRRVSLQIRRWTVRTKKFLSVSQVPLSERSGFELQFHLCYVGEASVWHGRYYVARRPSGMVVVMSQGVHLAWSLCRKASICHGRCRKASVWHGRYYVARRPSDMVVIMSQGVHLSWSL